MSQRYLGGVITANPTAPTLASASGVWTLEQQFQNLSGLQPTRISNSVRLRSSASAYFNRTPASATNRRTWTWSGWVKRGSIGVSNRIFAADDGSGSTDQDYNTLFFTSSNTLKFAGNLTDFRETTAVYRDPSAWYHIVFATDTTQSTAANRFRLYVNGAEVTAFTASNNPTQNTDLAVNAAIGHYLGAIATGPSGSYLDGYLTEINFIDGQALTPSSFGAFDSTGVWQPMAYAGTYGTNGFYLNFSDPSAATAAAIGKDYSGNGNNWTPNNISVTTGVTYDAMIDSPTNYATGTAYGIGNYAVLNPLYVYNANGTVSGANLDFTGGNNFWIKQATIPISVKNYCEVTVNTKGTNDAQEVGLTTMGVYDYIIEWVWSISGNRLYVNGVASGITMPQVVAGDVIGMAVDPVAKTCSLYRNNTLAATVTYAATTEITFYVGNTFTNGSWSGSINFGQRPFAYTPPTGFKALNTANLSVATINSGAQYMAATTYTGNGTSLAVVNSGAFQPDLVWIKSRSQVADHGLQDSVRGTPILYPNLAIAESTGGFWVSSYNSNGFTLNNNTSGNNSGSSYVGWQWKAAGSTVSNTSGTITSTVSANTTAGFSIAMYTGNAIGNATIGHGLGVAPAMVIIKNRAASTFWYVFHSSLAATYNLYLNDSTAQQADNVIRSTNSTTFTVSSSSAVNASGQSMVAYCFAQVAGYSRFGSYTGNGSTDGTFVYLGFRPRWVMTKRVDSISDWRIIDTSRDTYNVASAQLCPNLSSNEISQAMLDVLSNGFKIRNTDTGYNANGGTYIYAAFAENPFNTARAR